MLFKRRDPEPWRRKLLVTLWPRRSFSRSTRYAALRVMRMTGSPHGLALGVAAGVLIATLPLPGAQLILAAALAWLIGGNVPAALLATFWANPLTLPLLWFASHWLGETILSGNATTDMSDMIQRLSHVGGTLAASGGAAMSEVYAVLWPVLKPLALGAALLGVVSAIVFYGLTLHVIAVYRKGRLAAVHARDRILDRPPTPVLPLA